MSSIVAFAFAFAVVCSLVLGTESPARASAVASDTFKAVRIGTPPQLDARLADPSWARALTVGELETITTQNPSRFPGRFLLLYDDTNMYVGMRLSQSGVPITATQTAHGVGFGADDFAGIGIDPTGNGSEVYYFMTTPRGTRYQLASQSARYAPPWRAAAAEADGEWTAMLVIPLSALHTSPAASQHWRFNFIRRIAALNLNDSWAYDPVMSDGGGGVGNFPGFEDARYWPKLEVARVPGNTVRPRKPRAEIYALGVAGDDRRRFADADGRFSPQGSRGIGGDFVVPVNATTAFVGSVAPDFSNVEVDQQTITPQEFRRVVREYRPFFTQGATFFDPASLIGVNGGADRIFYSPSIGTFDRGLKIEGTSGLQSFGALETQGAGFDDVVFGYKHQTPNRAFSWSLNGVQAHQADGNATVDPRASSDTTLEAEVTGRNHATGFVYALDYARESGSFVRDGRLASRLDGFLDVHRPNYEVLTGWRDVGPSYAPVLGYTQNSDVRGPFGYVDLVGSIGHQHSIKRVDLFISGDRFLDRSGVVHQSDFSTTLDVQFNGGLHVSGGPSTSSLRTYGGSLVGWPTYAGGVTHSYDQHFVSMGWKEGSPAPSAASYSWGPFGGVYLQQVSASSARVINRVWNVEAGMSGTLERSSFGGPRDSQWLRRLTVGRTLDADTSVSVALRSVSGRGGFARPGLNLAGSFHHRFRNDDELFFNYGTVASPVTIQRWVLKYVMRIGGGAGT